MGNQMDLLLSVVILLFIGILWSIFVFQICSIISRRETKKNRRTLYIGLSLFFVIGAVFVISTAAVEFTESPYFCGQVCHGHEPYYDSYEEPGPNEMMNAHVDEGFTCSNCHDDPSINGKLNTMVIGAGKEVYVYTLGDYDPDNIEGHFARENCMKCHDGSETSYPDTITLINGSTATHPPDDKKPCADCHNPHARGYGYNNEGCQRCHDKTLKSVHAELECANCHGGKHKVELVSVDFDTCTSCKNHEELNEDVNELIHKEGQTECATSTCHTEDTYFSLQIHEMTEDV
jgi:hypothetical protein